MSRAAAPLPGRLSHDRTVKRVEPDLAAAPQRFDDVPRPRSGRFGVVDLVAKLVRRQGVATFGHRQGDDSGGGVAQPGHSNFGPFRGVDVRRDRRDEVGPVTVRRPLDHGVHALLGDHDFGQRPVRLQQSDADQRPGRVFGSGPDQSIQQKGLVCSVEGPDADVDDREVVAIGNRQQVGGGPIERHTSADGVQSVGQDGSSAPMARTTA